MPDGFNKEDIAVLSYKVEEIRERLDKTDDIIKEQNIVISNNGTQLELIWQKIKTYSVGIGIFIGVLVNFGESYITKQLEEPKKVYSEPEKKRYHNMRVKESEVVKDLYKYIELSNNEIKSLREELGKLKKEN